MQAQSKSRDCELGTGSKYKSCFGPFGSAIEDAWTSLPANPQRDDRINRADDGCRRMQAYVPRKQLSLRTANKIFRIQWSGFGLQKCLNTSEF